MELWAHLDPVPVKLVIFNLIRKEKLNYSWSQDSLVNQPIAIYRVDQSGESGQDTHGAALIMSVFSRLITLLKHLNLNCSYHTSILPSAKIFNFYPVCLSVCQEFYSKTSDSWDVYGKCFFYFLFFNADILVDITKDWVKDLSETSQSFTVVWRRIVLLVFILLHFRPGAVAGALINVIYKRQRCEYWVCPNGLLIIW